MAPNTPFLTSAVFENIDGISHGFFGRKGGISTGKYASLNAGHGSDDITENVTENRNRIAHAIGSKPEHLLSVHQHHSTDVIIATEPWGNLNPPEADAIVTNVVGIACTALAADCSPVLFVDPTARIIGAAHAGWRGALAGITGTTIEAMLSLGAKTDNIRTAIGPCLSQTHFEVGPEFVESFLSERQDNHDLFIQDLFTKGKTDRSHFDIKTYLERKLLRVGVQCASALPHCTYGQNSGYFSYRHNCHNQISDYGRNISAIMLKTK